ncbi:MAG: hypothetical protein HQL40_05645 [Alphaproteobacteria bacterium]|nr:hypothetical protein [Alphaproteobacteria bacterium]
MVESEVMDRQKDVNGATVDIFTETGDYRERWKHLEDDIERLIMRTADFVVFINKKSEIDWQTSKHYDDNIKIDKQKNNNTLNRAALLESMLDSGLPRVDYYKNLIAESIARSLDLDYRNAEIMLDRAEKFIKARRSEMSRYWYLIAAASMTLPFLLVGICLWLWRTDFVALLGKAGFILVLSSSAGAIGAVFSVIVRSGQFNFDSSAVRRLHYLEGGARIWAGAFSGFLAALAVKSELVLASLYRGETRDYLILLTAFVAGAGERLVGSIMARVENERAGQDEIE